jgi:MFS family permease
MPAVAADLGGLALYALAFGAPLATSVVGMAVAGAWSDATGGRRPLLAGVALLAASLVGCALAPSMPLFVLGRAVQGLGSGLLVVALYALVGAVVPEERRPRVFAWFAAAWVLPAMVGPALSGLVLQVASWRAVFLVVPALALPAALVMVPALRGTGHTPSERGAGALDVRRRILLATLAGVGAAVLQGAGTRREPVWLVLAGLALVVVLWSASRLLPAGTFRLRRGLPAVVAVRGLIGAGFVGAEAFLPLLLVRERGWTPGVAGLTLTVGAVAWSSTAWLQGRRPDIGVRYRLTSAGTLLLVVGLVCCLVAAAPGMPGLLVVVGWGFGGAGMGLSYSSTSLLALHLSPPERQGEASAALTTSEALAGAIALALAGTAFAAALPAGIGPSAPAGSAPYLAGLGVAAVGGLLAGVAAQRLAPRNPT